MTMGNTIRHNEVRLLLRWMVIVVLTFFALDFYYISVGDDLGYIYSDSKLHKCDGDRISGITDCIATQISHYKTTNGRFIVHVLTHFFTALSSRIFYIILNSLMFGALWLLVYRSVYQDLSIKGGRAIFILFLLWLLLPAPGVMMLGLVSFSLNYMWTGVACLLFLTWIDRCFDDDREVRGYRLILYSLGSLVIGSLHEGYSLPIIAALCSVLILYRKRANYKCVILILCFTIGGMIEILAPGNFAHLSQGGGLSVENVIRKVGILLPELIYSSISILILIILMISIFKRGIIKRFIADRRNIVLIVAVIVSILFACLTFTSIRQLFAPSLFSIILIARLVSMISIYQKFGSVGVYAMGIVLSLLFISSLLIRYNTYLNFNKSIETVKSAISQGEKIVEIDVSDANYNRYGKMYKFVSRYDCDPMYDEYLHLVYDGYTKRGLSRMYSIDERKTHIHSVLPYSKERIVSAFDKSYPDISITDERKCVPTTRLDEVYRAVRIPLSEQFNLPFPSIDAKSHIKHEKFNCGNYSYYVVPSVCDTIWFCKW